MSLNLFNTLTSQKEEFKPIDTKTVGMYNCGPTVYDYPHIGNLRAYVFADILRRTLEWNHYQVKQVMNITDIGHLTSDSDEGEDKMTKALRRENKPLTLEAMSELADFYIDQFKENLEALNIKTPTEMPRASEHIAEDIEIIKTLETKGFTYHTSDGIYFDTSKKADYGKLVPTNFAERNPNEQNSEHSRIGGNPEKKDQRDFALWKFSAPKSSQGVPLGGLEGSLGFESPWGKGFPGWHIECSAMSMKYLGETFDLHTGGIDHIPVHHNNEIAQSEATTGKDFVHYWLHNAHLQIADGKMSKSEGNFITLKTLEEHRVHPLTLRYWLLTAHYRSPLNFTWDAVTGAGQALSRLAEITKGEVGKASEKYLTDFTEAINDDLNTPQAIALAWDLTKDSSIPTPDKVATLLEFDKVLGLSLQTLTLRQALKLDDLPTKIQNLIKEREVARKNNDFETADRLRSELKSEGFELKDTEQGPEISIL